MKQALRQFWKSVPAVALVYMPLILLWMEFYNSPFRAVGWWRLVLSSVLFGGGITLFIWSYRLLLNEGKGRPLQAVPAKHLVKDGPYQYIRNPMGVGIVMALLGEAGYFGSWYLLGWALFMGVVIAVYVVRVEEYKLANQFGEEYVNYKMDVGRFWPKNIKKQLPFI